ncbi:ThuA-like domain-containing protein [Deinococcus saxicola]|uniref:ThuA domain-containing protein n=1 Tax=Deinococcus saxicola TaxID=249406 RepID=UPI0039EFFC9E
MIQPLNSTALIISGGWPGHQPQKFAEIIGHWLKEDGLEVTQTDTLEVLDDAEAVARYSLIIPNWTMGKITETQSQNLRQAVQDGVNLAGFHGGMGDSFRDDAGFQFMVGGQFVAHPGDMRPYRVDLTNTAHPITDGLSGFEMQSEQYYLHVDPSNTVLATTTFDASVKPWIDGTVMPVAWVRRHGAGRVFYSSLGHDPREFDQPEVAALHRRGLRWAVGRL